MKVNSDTSVKCPYCNVDQCEPAIDYTFPNKVGDASEAYDWCNACDMYFNVKNNGDGTCEIIGLSEKARQPRTKV